MIGLRFSPQALRRNEPNFALARSRGSNPAHSVRHYYFFLLSSFQGSFTAVPTV